ncbi:MAG: DNA replication/repair protein RecF, partial [Myxococcales bacterium]
MRLLALEIQDLRNIAHAVLTPAEQATLVVGPNGQGKTNLLEALYVLATLRPLRANRFSELVRFGQERARVAGRFLLGGAERVISVEIAGGTREAFVDGKPARSLGEYFGGVSVVAFTPDDLAAVKGGPDLRRRLLDRAVFNRFPAHLEASREYARALKGRNKLLKERAAPALLDVWNEALAKAGARVVSRRRALVNELSGRAAAACEAIARGDGGLEVDYAPSGVPAGALDDEAQVREALYAVLSARTGADLERGFTSVGPHTDDLDLVLNGRAARSYASQGQQRAIVLAFKIAEIENLQATLGRPPLLLLDDVSSELDPARNAFLMEYLRAQRLQVFLTTTDAQLVRPAAGPDARCFTVRA